MVFEVAANPGQIMDYRKAHFRQVGLWANAGQQHQVGRTYGAGRQNYFRPLNGESIAAGLYFQPGGLLSFEEYPLDVAIGPDGEVQAVAGQV